METIRNIAHAAKAAAHGACSGRRVDVRLAVFSKWANLCAVCAMVKNSRHDYD
jgi:hypothetical protein